MFDNKKILILGMARSGYEAAKLLSKYTNKIIVTDQNEQDADHVLELENLNVKVVITKEPLYLLDEDTDFVIKNPGITFLHPLIKKAEELNIKVINEMEAAYLLMPKDIKIVGITGSNGKTTTTTLIYEMLKRLDTNVYLGGNIGFPLCSLVEKVKSKDILVLEISGHQLHDMKEFKVDISVMTNLYQVHLDFFLTYDYYKEMKSRIFRHHNSNDIAIINSGNSDVLEVTKDLKSKKITFSAINDADLHIKDDAIYYYDELIIKFEDIRIKGMHNYENIMCAIAVGKALGMKTSDIKDSINDFGGVEHRIEFVKKINNREFYNDSKSTNVESTIVALKSFESPVILLLGGLDRNHPFDDLKEHLKHVKHIVCYGETKNRIKEFADKIKIECTVVDNLKEATNYAYNISNVNDTILLSPACASWDQYKDYEVRGKEFKRIVEELEGK